MFCLQKQREEIARCLAGVGKFFYWSECPAYCWCSWQDKHGVAHGSRFPAERGSGKDDKNTEIPKPMLELFLDIHLPQNFKKRTLVQKETKMQPPFPCPTATWHNDTYESISPSRPELSVTGKTIVVVGGGSGIGRETALAFATAGAAHVALLGRTEARLQETAASISSTGKTSCSVHVADITQAESLAGAAAAVGKWHVLVMCSGYCPDPSAIPSSEEAEWWKGFETNVNGTYLTTRAFLPTADPSQAAILGVVSDTSLMPVSYLPGLSSYVSSKLAQAKIYEFLAAENPNIFIATINPGMIETDNFNRTGAKPEMCPMDKVQLPAHFLVWMASPEAAFLRGRCTWANWDVEELKAQKTMISEGLFMTAGFKGLPKA